MRSLLLFTIVFLLIPQSLIADAQDPLDPFDRAGLEDTQKPEDDSKTAEELIEEASLLLVDERLLDARSKLLKALSKDPKAYRAHMMLAGYYTAHVGHFRLALKYAKQARNLFFEKNGQPPYIDLLKKAEHRHLLYLLAQIRLNLDDYQGALDILDRYTGYGYYEGWYPGSRAWVLMKLGRLDDAIQVANMGILTGAEPGRTLNMLGILLSMKGERDASLKVFDQAIRYELSLGEKRGQPATPLNNAGEVYNETFKESQAENSWKKSTSLPDGCEHVLPSLNLCRLYIDQGKLISAARVINNFESCVAKYPLRNGEEHRALVHLARGRIALHSGYTEAALKHLESTLDRRQWFGKIGTSEEDLRAASRSSLALALEAYANRLHFKLPESFAERVQLKYAELRSRVASWWYLRRARQIVTQELRGFEDLFIRNTDSLLEYPSLGVLLRTLPVKLVQKRIALETIRDKRSESFLHYNLYRAENLLYHGYHKEGLELLEQVLAGTREGIDELLKLNALTTKLQHADLSRPDSIKLAHMIFRLNPGKLRNSGIRMPVSVTGGSKEINSLLNDSGFEVVSDSNLPYTVEHSKTGKEHIFQFTAMRGMGRGVRARGEDLVKTLNKFHDEVFAVRLGGVGELVINPD